MTEAEAKRRAWQFIIGIVTNLIGLANVASLYWFNKPFAPRSEGNMK